MALIGDPISPQKMHEWGVVNEIASPEKLLPTALKYAKKICENSPDAVVVSRTGMLMSLERGLRVNAANEDGSIERGTQLHNLSHEVEKLETGFNISEGLAAFKEKRSPKWRSSKL
jgi:mevalonyl-CoA hydratase